MKYEDWKDEYDDTIKEIDEANQDLIDAQNDFAKAKQDTEKQKLDAEETSLTMQKQARELEIDLSGRLRKLNEKLYNDLKKATENIYARWNKIAALNEQITATQLAKQRDFKTITNRCANEVVANMQKYKFQGSGGGFGAVMDSNSANAGLIKKLYASCMQERQSIAASYNAKLRVLETQLTSAQADLDLYEQDKARILSDIETAKQEAIAKKDSDKLYIAQQFDRLAKMVDSLQQASIQADTQYGLRTNEINQRLTRYNGQLRALGASPGVGVDTTYLSAMSDRNSAKAEYDDLVSCCKDVSGATDICSNGEPKASANKGIR